MWNSLPEGELLASSVVVKFFIKFIYCNESGRGKIGLRYSLSYKASVVVGMCEVTTVLKCASTSLFT